MKSKNLFVALPALALTATALTFAQSDSPTSDGKNNNLSQTENASPSRVPDKAEDIRPLLIGSKIPAIKLRDTGGKSFDLNSFIKAKPAVLIFYRGGWCPFCNKQLAGLRNTHEPLKKLGFEVLAISPDSALPASDAEKNAVGYKLLSDSSMEAARALGIAFRMDNETLQKYREYGIDLEKSSGEKHHQLPVPAVFLVGRDGTIHFSFVNPNYQVRLAPEILLAAARAYQKDASKAPFIQAPAKKE